MSIEKECHLKGNYIFLFPLSLSGNPSVVSLCITSIYRWLHTILVNRFQTSLSPTYIKVP